MDSETYGQINSYQNCCTTASSTWTINGDSVTPVNPLQNSLSWLDFVTKDSDSKKLENRINMLESRISYLENLINEILEKVDETKIVSLLSESDEKDKS